MRPLTPEEGKRFEAATGIDPELVLHGSTKEAITQTLDDLRLFQSLLPGMISQLVREYELTLQSEPELAIFFRLQVQSLNLALTLLQLETYGMKEEAEPGKAIPP